MPKASTTILYLDDFSDLDAILDGWQIDLDLLDGYELAGELAADNGAEIEQERQELTRRLDLARAIIGV